MLGHANCHGHGHDNRYGHGNSHAYADPTPTRYPYGYGNRHGDRLANAKLLAHADGRCIDFQHVA